MSREFHAFLRRVRAARTIAAGRAGAAGTTARAAGGAIIVPERAGGPGIVGRVRALQGTVPDKSAASRGRATMTVQPHSPVTAARHAPLERP